MTRFLLMRHGEADYSHSTRWKSPGWGADIAPLTARGVTQVSDQFEELLQFNPEIVLCSPMPRALHTALVVRERVPVPFCVEFDLHEWVPHLRFEWSTLEEMLALQRDFYLHAGEWPNNDDRDWEPKSSIKHRTTQVLDRYLGYERVLVICHGMVIESLTGQRDVRCAELVPYTV